MDFAENLCGPRLILLPPPRATFADSNIDSTRGEEKRNGFFRFTATNQFKFKNKL